MTLALTYRPADFSELIGNEANIKAIQAILKRPRAEIPHAWFFQGPSGCGKTTLGRIVATKGLGCVGRDYYEIDTADFRGIDTIRDIRKVMQFQPMEGPCRVWLLDECHRLSGDAQDALLKALEEAPDHVYFILCTAEPQKLPAMLKSRMISFEVEALTEGQIAKLLREVAAAERKRVHKDVVEQISRDCLGNCRAALQILEKVVDLDPADMLEVAKQTAVRDNAVIDLCRSLIKGEKWPKVAAIITGLEKESIETIRLGVLGYAASVLLKGDDPRAYLILDSFKDPFYNAGKAGLVRSCYEVLNA